MKILINNKPENVFNAHHNKLYQFFKNSNIIISDKKKPNISHTNIDGFSIRTILKPNNNLDKNYEDNIFNKYKFPKNINFHFANCEPLNRSSAELNRVRTLHRMIYKAFPIKIRNLKLKLDSINSFSPNYNLKKKKINSKIFNLKIYLKELKYEFKIRKKIAYHVSNILIPSIYIIKRKKQGIVQAKWIFLGIEQKRIHLGMIKNLKSFDNKKLRNMTIKIIKNNYGAPFDKLSNTWITKENLRLKKWKATINNITKIKN